MRGRGKWQQDRSALLMPTSQSQCRTHREGHGPSRQPLLQTPQFRSPYAHISDHLAVNFEGVLWALSGLIICWNSNHNLVKCCTYNYSFILKDANQGQLSEEVPRAELLFPSPRIQSTSPSGRADVLAAGSSREPLYGVIIGVLFCRLD